MVKYRIGLTIQSEALFSMIARLLPVEDFDVEEMRDAPPPQIKHQSVVAKLIADGSAPKKQRKSPPGHFKHDSGKTCSDFVLEYLNQKPTKEARWAELGNHVFGLGFSKSSINNGITRLLEKGLIEKRGPALYGLKKK